MHKNLKLNPTLILGSLIHDFLLLSVGNIKHKTYFVTGTSRLSSSREFGSTTIQRQNTSNPDRTSMVCKRPKTWVFCLL